MTKIEILLKASAANEMGILKACESYPIPTNEYERTELEYLIKKVREHKNNLPHGKVHSSARRIRTWCINTLEDKLEEYLINTLTKN